MTSSSVFKLEIIHLSSVHPILLYLKKMSYDFHLFKALFKKEAERVIITFGSQFTAKRFSYMLKYKLLLFFCNLSHYQLLGEKRKMQLSGRKRGVKEMNRNKKRRK